MPRKSLNPTPWREKRKQREACVADTRKVAKANRERFRRQKEAAFKKANDIFLDGLDTGRERHVYVLVMDKTRSGPRYSAYDSHPVTDWVPTTEEVASNWPKTEPWDPSSFNNIPARVYPSHKIPQGTLRKAPVIPRPPLLRF